MPCCNYLIFKKRTRNEGVETSVDEKRRLTDREIRKKTFKPQAKEGGI